MTLSEEDLYKLSYSPRIFSLLRRLNVKELLDVVKQWFDHDELKPLRRSATWEEYESIKSQKQKVLDQIVLDWPNGLYMVQAAQLDLKYVMNHQTGRTWKLWELQSDKDDPSRLETMLDISTVQERIHRHMTNAFVKCHVHVSPNDTNDTHWLRITLFENKRSTELPRVNHTAYLVRYPDTQYLLSGGSIRKETRKLVIQSLLRAFSAKSIRERNLSSKKLEAITNIALNNKSLGPFSEFRLNQVDGNPLDVLLQTKKRPRTPEYVTGREKKKRIVPLDKKLIESRYKTAMDTFGINTVQGVESLKINLSTSLENVISANVRNATEELNDNLPLTIEMHGPNVMEGLRQLMYHGILEPPIPEWMIEMASQGINIVYVTKDGVLREKEETDTDDEEEEEASNDENTQRTNIVNISR